MTGSGTPASTSQLAQVCRRSWILGLRIGASGVLLIGLPSASLVGQVLSTAADQTRSWKPLLLTKLPALFRKTHSPVRSSLSRVAPGTLMVRTDRFVLGGPI